MPIHLLQKNNFFNVVSKILFMNELGSKAAFSMWRYK